MKSNLRRGEIESLANSQSNQIVPEFSGQPYIMTA